MLDTPIKILLIEDNPGDARLIREMLADAPAQDIAIEGASRLSQGLDYLGQGKIDLVLLDLDLPDSRGLDTFLKASTHAPSIPFVILTGLDDEDLALAAMERGAQDYLVKGKMDGRRLLRVVRYATERKKRQEALQQAHDELERRVEERTADLVNINLKLQISNEELSAQAEELRIQEDTLHAQARELQAQKIELEELTQLMVGRELKMSELKEEIMRLKKLKKDNRKA